MTTRLFFSGKVPSKKKLLAFAHKICGKVKRLQQDKEIYIIFVSDHQIKKLNKTFFNRNCTTDVIAFPYKNSLAFSELRLATNCVSLNAQRSMLNDDLPFGDIYISMDTARCQAESGKHSLLQELALLVLHGLLHLAGYEDEPPAKKKKMFQMQKKLFLELAPNLAPPDIL